MSSRYFKSAIISDCKSIQGNLRSNRNTFENDHADNVKRKSLYKCIPIGTLVLKE